MNYAVKFCGGCNSRYDRTDVYQKLKRKHKNLRYAEADQPCDILYVICGCTAQCTDISGINAGKTVWIHKNDFPS